ncbi:MAG TPA: hypothetical protein VGB54_03005 [Allosphingosinicella sp.]|jgi:hypothetical protein
MSFTTFAAAVLLLMVPVLILAALIRGIVTLDGSRAYRTDRPLAFWLHLTGSVAFFLGAASLLWTHGERGLQVLPAASLAFALVPTMLALSKALRTGRISGTTRTSQPAAYWSAMFGMLLFLLFIIAALAHSIWFLLDR